mgnify:CR=1 FL=1
MSIQVCVTGLVAYLSQKLGVTFYLLGILLCLMVIDYLSGMAASAVEALVIAVGMVIDYVIIQTSGVLGFNLPNTMLSLLVTVWYMLNEALSITENAGRMGAPVPEWLMKYIAALKNKIDSSRENVSSET